MSVSFRLLPFGAGRRVCPGEVLARNRIFLIFVSMMQKFTFQASEGKDAPDSDPRNMIQALVNRVRPYKIHALKRQ